MKLTHSFSVELACQIGVEKAILIGYIRHWTVEMEKKKSPAHFMDNRYWTYGSAKVLAEKLPYLNARSINRWCDELERDGFIVTHTINTANGKQTAYTIGKNIDSEGLAKMTEAIGQNDQAIGQNDQCIYKDTIQSTYQSTIQSTVHLSSSAPTKKNEVEKIDIEIEALPAHLPSSNPGCGPPLSSPKIPFDAWWGTYDKKRDRPDCETAWEKLSPDEQQRALTHTGRYVEGTPKQFRKDPIRYLKRKSWNDEIIESHESGQQRTNSAKLVAPGHVSAEQKLGKVAALFRTIDLQTG